jgi:hypothetical protein
VMSTIYRFLANTTLTSLTAVDNKLRQDCGSKVNEYRNSEGGLNLLGQFLLASVSSVICNKTKSTIISAIKQISCQRINA